MTGFTERAAVEAIAITLHAEDTGQRWGSLTMNKRSSWRIKAHRLVIEHQAEYTLSMVDEPTP